MSEPNAVVFRVGLDGRGGLAEPVEDGASRWTHFRLTEDGAD